MKNKSCLNETTGLAVHRLVYCQFTCGQADTDFYLRILKDIDIIMIILISLYNRRVVGSVETKICVVPCELSSAMLIPQEGGTLHPAPVCPNDTRKLSGDPGEI